MSFKMILLSVPLMFAVIGCKDSKKAEEPAEPAAQKPAPKADRDPPVKVDVHITTDHQPAPAPEPKPNGLSITIGAEADLEVK